MKPINRTFIVKTKTSPLVNSSDLRIALALAGIECTEVSEDTVENIDELLSKEA